MNTNIIQSKRNYTDFITDHIIRIILIIMLVVNLYPLVFVLFTSFKNTSEFLENIWSIPKRINFENYALAWTNGHIGEYFFNSVIVSVVSLAVIIVFASIAAYALAKLNIPLAEIIAAMMLIIIILPTESMIIPLYISMVKLKFINVKYIPMIIAYIGWCLPFAIVVLKNFFQTLPSELMEAARIDGSGELQTLLKIVIPLMVPAIGTTLVFNFCFIWGELMWAQIATASVDTGLTLTCGIVTFQGAFETDWGPMSAAIAIILLPLFFVFLFLQKYFIEGLTAGAVKG